MAVADPLDPPKQETFILFVVTVRGAGGALITAVAEETEVHVDIPSVTVNVYVFAVRPVKTVVVPVPVEVRLPGIAVMVQVPAAGSPLRATLPVASRHVGCVIVPIIGAAGIAGAGLTVSDAPGADMHVGEAASLVVSV